MHFNSLTTASLTEDTMRAIYPNSNQIEGKFSPEKKKHTSEERQTGSRSRCTSVQRERYATVHQVYFHAFIRMHEL